MLKLEVSQPLHYLYIIVNMQMLSFLSIVSFIGLNKKKAGGNMFYTKRTQTFFSQSQT